ncbi:MAG: excinuclease ABC subunit UvrA [Bacteroidales bacterium]
MKNMETYIDIQGARAHNLKDISCRIPRNNLIVITGISGSGKSSLAFDTIYAEGQRRYLETFSAYARQFLAKMERPEVDKITGLSPVISIEQKSTNKNPRSTVGTITEIYDFLRLLFARAGKAYSWKTGAPMIRYTTDQIRKIITNDYAGRKIILLSPLVRGRKGHYQELFERIRQKGFLQIRVDGEFMDITPGMKLDRYRIHHVEVVIDKLKLSNKTPARLKKSLSLALDMGNGICQVYDIDYDKNRFFSKHFMCPDTGLSYDEPAPHNFSFNSPYGACPECNGLGEVRDFDINKIMPNTALSIRQGGLKPLGKYKNMLLFWQLEALLRRYKADLDTPISKLPDNAIQEILYGTEKPLSLRNTPLGTRSSYELRFDGILSLLKQKTKEEKHLKTKNKWSEQFIHYKTCQECNGQRLKKESLHFLIHDKNIAELAKMDLTELVEWFEGLEKHLDNKQLQIAREILKEIRSRLTFLLDVGLEYLALNRPAKSLSGGEAQRIRLATQVGSQLVNVLYILDEPSIGLHQRDNQRLINTLKNLRDKMNSVMVVEHDQAMIESADFIVDMGPGAGNFGGKIVAQGTPDDIRKATGLTSDYLAGRKIIPIPGKRRIGKKNKLTIKGCHGNNLKNIDVEFPLGKLICITGVSGSGKSSLIDDTLYPALSQHFYQSTKTPLGHKSIEGLNNIDKVIEVNQAPLGRTPRSNPITYTGIFTDIRHLFAQLPESKIRGYQMSRFSFNVKGGRCETCKGAGMMPVEMNFLPNVYVQCKDCNGKRYNKETLQVRYRGKSINDVLNLTVNRAIEFFDNIPKLQKKLKVLQEVGLGYITLGQPSTTISGGESQRVKLAAELIKKDTGKTMYILDEPTTGLHFEDVKVLMEVLGRLTDKGNTIVIIEHNPDVIKLADHIIDLGPEGGKKGGYLLCSGAPEDIINNQESYTAKLLQEIFNQNKKAVYE